MRTQSRNISALIGYPRGTRLYERSNTLQANHQRKDGSSKQTRDGEDLAGINHAGSTTGMSSAGGGSGTASCRQSLNTESGTSDDRSVAIRSNSSGDGSRQWSSSCARATRPKTSPGREWSPSGSPSSPRSSTRASNAAGLRSPWSSKSTTRATAGSVTAWTTPSSPAATPVASRSPS